jgi:deoxyribonuclease V
MDGRARAGIAMSVTDSAPAHGWPATRAALVAAQEALAAARPEPWRPGQALGAVAGAFVCFARTGPGAGAAGDRGWAGAALLLEHEPPRIAVVSGAAPAPYVPGLLALREGALLEAAVRRLALRPEVLLVNATGRDHPRRAGLAVHLGAILDLPTVGVTARPLLATGEPPADAPGATSPLRIAGETVACWLRLRRGVAPLVVHPGWRTDLAVAVAVVRATAVAARTPEPLRQARRAAREARAASGRAS